MRRNRTAKITAKPAKAVVKKKRATPKKRRPLPAPEVEIEEIVPDLVIPPPPPQGPEPDHDFSHPVVRVDLRIAPTLFEKLRALSAQDRAALNVRIVGLCGDAVA